MCSRRLVNEPHLVSGIQARCRPRNLLDNVSSVLFVSDSIFLQLIEGKAGGPVCRTIKRMIGDDRHAVKWIYSFAEPHRVFVGTIPFLVVDDSEQLSRYFDDDEWAMRRSFDVDSAELARHFLFRLVMIADPNLLTRNLEPGRRHLR